MQTLVNTTVSHYEILAELGRGGMGVVYKARDIRLDRFAALKFLSPQYTQNGVAKERFIREAQSAAATEHTNICNIYEIDETPEGQIFIAMAFYEGSTVKQLIQRGRVPLGDALDYAAQVAEGLERAHRKGIVHRDIKPANVIVTADKTAKILDFGIAKLAGVSEITRSGDTVGTLSYMSPEQVTGSDVDNRSDLWSLGVVLFEMLSGVRPFVADYEQAVMYSILNQSHTQLSALVPDLPPAVGRIVDRCLEKDPNSRFETAGELAAVLFRSRQGSYTGGSVIGPTEGPTTETAVEPSSEPSTEHTTRTASSTSRRRIFVSYKRGGKLDEELARALLKGLAETHDVFVDDLVQVGARWVQQIEAEIASSDVVIVLLSSESVNSEMVLGEVEMAKRLAVSNTRPAILPVRVAYGKPFSYPLNTYLDGLRSAFWGGEQDTERLVEHLKTAVEAGFIDASDTMPTMIGGDTGVIPEPLMAAQPLASAGVATRVTDGLEAPEGTMDPQSALYVERPADAIALREIGRQGVTITIKGPRQMGKSSLLMRTAAAAAEAGKQVVFLDFQLFDRTALEDPDIFFRQFCAWITDELDLEDKVEEYWARPLGNSQKCTRYMGRHVLKSVAGPIVLAMDEVETVFDTSFRSDFFSMLRSWHNDRAIKMQWKMLDLALVTSTEPYQLIENLNQSPFNVGQVIELTDFTEEQVAEANEKHDNPLSEADLGRLNDLLSGHPYLIRKALYLIASRHSGLDELFSAAVDERGPFGDHLRNHLFRLRDQPALVEGLKQVLSQQRCSDEGVFWRLRGAGLVRRDGNTVVARCRLYADYFAQRLNV